MDRRIETRVIDTAGAAATNLIQKDPCEVYWISVSPETANTKGLIKIIDGFDTNGKLKWQQEPAYSRQYNFIPPVPCDQALAVYHDTAIGCYTIAYRPKSWRKEQG